MPRTKILNTVNISSLLSIDDASKHLGTGFSRDTILKLIRQGEWKQGKHYFRMGRAQNAPIRVDVEAIAHWIAEINTS